MTTTTLIAPLSSDDYEVTLKSVTKNGQRLEYASNRLRNHPDIVMAAVLQDPMSLVYASNELQNDKALLLNIIGNFKNGGSYIDSFLHMISRDFLTDVDIIFAAVQKCGSTIRLASPELRDSKKIALAAMSNFPSAFRYLSDTLKSSLDIVEVAVRLDGMNFMHIKSNSLRNRLDLLYEALYHNADLYYSLSGRVQENKAVEYIHQHAYNIDDAIWPVVKQALLVNPDVIIEPPLSILSIFADDTIPYLTLADYALQGNMNFVVVDPFDFLE